MLLFSTSIAPAIIGLVGVVIGGALAGTVNFLLARRAERQDVRTAARLVRAELQGLDVQLLSVRTREVFGGQPPDLADLAEILSEDRRTAWHENRNLLARGLPSKEWDKVASGCRSFLSIETQVSIWKRTKPEAMEEVLKGYHEAIALAVGALYTAERVNRGFAYRLGRVRWVLRAINTPEDHTDLLETIAPLDSRLPAPVRRLRWLRNRFRKRPPPRPAPLLPLRQPPRRAPWWRRDAARDDDG
jgi:hypothetical protein